MFVATANTLNIPPALLDRMEVIRLSGYTEDEKMNIGIKYLLPKQMKNTGLKEGELSISEAAVRDIVRYYTREAGVRDGARASKICRKAVKQLLIEKRRTRTSCTASRSPPRIWTSSACAVQLRHGREAEPGRPGHRSRVDRGRGRVLTIEAVTMPGKGKTITTGKLGEVMQESIQAALSVVRALARSA